MTEWAKPAGPRETASQNKHRRNSYRKKSSKGGLYFLQAVFFFSFFVACESKDPEPIGSEPLFDSDGDGFSDVDEENCGSDRHDKTSVPVDTDSDGDCNARDSDDDNDGSSDEEEQACSSDPLDSASLPKDTDLDGLCDDLDEDDDGDGVNDVLDSAPTDPTKCADTDSDTCDDCSSGHSDTANDGADSDSDGICDAGDTESPLIGLFVDSGAPGCSDTGAGSASDPFCSLATAVAEAAEGDSIWIASGSYGAVVISKALTLTGGRDPQAEWAAGNGVSVLSSLTSPTVRISSADVVLAVLTIEGAAIEDDSSYALELTTAADAEIQDCIVQGGSALETTPGGVGVEDVAGILSRGVLLVLNSTVEAGLSTGTDNADNAHAIFNRATADLTVKNSRLLGGSSHHFNYAVTNEGDARISQSYLYGGDATINGFDDVLSLGFRNKPGGSATLVNNVISGGTSEDKSYSIWNSGPLVVVNNYLAAGEATSNTYVFQNGESGAAAVLVNNVMDWGQAGSVERGLFHDARQGATLVIDNNAFFGEGNGKIMDIYPASGSLFSISDISELHQCAFDGCISATSNLLQDPGYIMTNVEEPVLSEASVAVDAGRDPSTDLGSNAALSAVDAQGQSRPIDGDEVGGAAWDIGPDEFQP